MRELTYSRKNIVRTVAIGFTLGALVLSTAAIVVIFSLALMGIEPFTLATALGQSARLLIASVGGGIVLGWIVRLGLGIHAWWQYSRNPARMTPGDFDT